MKLRLASLLMLTLIQGEIFVAFSVPNNENVGNAVISNSDTDFPNVTNSIKAFLPSQVNDNVNVKHRKALKKREIGRPVNIPSDVVERMANIPVSALSSTLPDIQKTILDTHNKYRSQASPSAKNMLKMVWNAEAAKTAGDWAKKCQAGHSPQNLREITNFKCGENIFLANFKVPWDTVVDSWYSEYVDYKYGTGATSNAEVGHYTQLMWATSYALGCDVAECSTGNNKYIYVCHCCPSGNKGSRLFPWKEGKSCEDCPNSCENNLCTNPCPYQNFFSNCPDFKNNCPTDPTMKTNCPAACLCTKGEIC
ncbi:serotriflin-like [Rhinoderma darwinii]|uniref:serotriflin-like n=1 Tax=Rhinoderma darwinii TaxID=43563 RepID=UPI003F6795CE